MSRSTCSPATSARWSTLFAALGAAACRSQPSPPPEVNVEHGEWSVPAPNDGRDPCADLRDVRVCWGKDGPKVTPATFPFPGATAITMRCTGTAAARRCVDRRRDAPPFRCSGERCEQALPRLPDHGEWECADLGGIVVCHGGDTAAGIAPAGTDPSFVCGTRRGGSDERVCVDHSPDLPEVPGAYRCRFERRPEHVRVCERAFDVHGAGDVCDRARPCVSGLACVANRCVPPAPPPACWLDADCPAGAPCRFGACVEGAP